MVYRTKRNSLVEKQESKLELSFLDTCHYSLLLHQPSGLNSFYHCLNNCSNIDIARRGEFVYDI